MFAPEAVLPTQHEPHREATGVRGLVLGVLELALRDLESDGRYGREAREWVASDDVAPFSFAWVCEVLGLEAAALRTRLLAGTVARLRRPGVPRETAAPGAAA